MGIAENVAGGSLLFAMLLAFAAGIVSFAGPCVLPLAPGYLSYVTGLTGAEIAGEESSGAKTTTLAVKSRVLVGSVLFVLGFSVVFVSYGLLFGGLGSLLLEYQAVISRVLGVIVILMGLSFMGVLPGMQREWRMHRMPSYSVWGAPSLGVLFGLARLAAEKLSPAEILGAGRIHVRDVHQLVVHGRVHAFAARQRLERVARRRDVEHDAVVG